MPPPASPESNFENAARDAMAFLHARVGFDLWMVTRTEDDDWIVLHTEDHGYDVAEGAVLKWTDSFCSRMVRGEGPRIAPNSDDVPAYAAAPIGQQIEIGAYAGVPMNRADGTLFGTLCAVDPDPQPQAVADDLPLIEFVGRMLGHILDCDQDRLAQARRAERAEHQALCDPLTGLYNRRGWDRLLISEQSRCERYASPACVLSIDLDGMKRVNDTQGHAAGDTLLRAAADAMLIGLRDQDIVARVGGDEFMVLGVECNANGTDHLIQRLTQCLTEAGVAATIGWAQHQSGGTLTDTAARADRDMLAKKPPRSAG